MTLVAEMLPAPQVETIDVVSDEELQLSQMIGLAEKDLRGLMAARVYYLGNIELDGEEPYPALRAHCGPVGAILRGGTKFKPYLEIPMWQRDGINHAVSMFDKIGALGETDYAGGKTVVNIDPNPRGMSESAKHDRLVEALDQLAGLIIEAGLDDPFMDGTAGDENTNGEIGRAFLNGLKRRGVPHAEACVTGKPDMIDRPAATGRGAAISKRTSMRLRGQKTATWAIQGGGFAGGYAAAEAFDPKDSADRDTRLNVGALGDLDNEKRPATIVSGDREGLPITYEMMDQLLLDPHDPEVRRANGNKLGGLALKLEKAGADIKVVPEDVLTIDPGYWENPALAPAATSNVIGLHNIKDIKIREIDEIGNRTIKSELITRLKEFGMEVEPGEIRNAGGVYMSMEENRRDLARIKAQKSGQSFPPETSEAYGQRLRTAMMRTTQRAHEVSEAYFVDRSTAAKMVALGNYALAQGMSISPQMSDLLLKAA